MGYEPILEPNEEDCCDDCGCEHEEDEEHIYDDDYDTIEEARGEK